MVVRLVKKPEVPKINYEKFTFNVKELEMSEDDKNKEVEKASEAELFNQLINMTGEMLRWKEKCQMTEDKLKRIRIVENESHS